MIVENIPIEVIFKELKIEEHTLYKIKVKCSKNNVKHNAFLFTGFKNGAYCVIYTNSYDNPIHLKDCYEIQISKKLSKIKSF